MFFGCDCCDNTAVVGSLFSYKIFIAIAAQASEIDGGERDIYL